jgi:UDP-glucose 4-epimerase
MNMKKTVLITGVAGLIGSRLSDWILQNTDYQVIGVDDLSGGFANNINEDVIFFKRNIVEGLEDIFEKYKPEYVYHFAAYAAEGLSPFIRKFNYKNNLLATADVVNNCIKHDIKRLVFTSTLAVYGRGYGGIFDEDQIPKPIDPYGVAKYGCEMDIRIAEEQHGLDWCIIRPHNVFGIKQNIWDKYRNVLGIWMYQHLNGEPMTIFGDGSQTRAFSYIDDCLKPLWNSATKKGASKQIINLGGIHEYSINQANEILKEVVGGGETSYHEQRFEVKHSIPTYQKSIDILDFKHETNLKEGLDKMWEWAKEQPMRKRFFWGKYEISKGIYKYWKTE